MSTHNICFCGEIRKYQYVCVKKSALPGAIITCYLLMLEFSNSR